MNREDHEALLIDFMEYLYDIGFKLVDSKGLKVQQRHLPTRIKYYFGDEKRGRETKRE